MAVFVNVAMVTSLKKGAKIKTAYTLSELIKFN